VAVDSVVTGGTRTVTFPAWNVGPESTVYAVRMHHNCGPDQNRRNDTLYKVTTATELVMRVAIEISSGSVGRTPPNACYMIDSLCDAQGWEDSIVSGEDIDEPSELANYTVVVTGDVGHSDNDFNTYESALAEWVRGGGGFVGLGWIVFGIANKSAWIMDSVLPVSSRSHYQFLTSGQVNIIDNTHPVTPGVNNFNIYSHGEYAAAGMWPGATMLADYTAAPGEEAVAVMTPGSGRSVYLGPIYFGAFQTYSNEPYYSDPDAMRLLKQAIEWAAMGGGTGMEERPEPPGVARLTGVAPNPFDAATTISYTLPVAGRVKLAVYDLAGKLVRTLANGVQSPGAKRLVWNRTDGSGRELARGVYFLRFETEGSVQARKLVLR